MWISLRSYDCLEGNFTVNLDQVTMVQEHDRYVDFHTVDGEYVRAKKTPQVMAVVDGLLPGPEITPEDVKAPKVEEEWVTQDKVRVRPGIDQYRYVKKNGSVVRDWRYAQLGDGWDAVCCHGWVDGDGETLELRCLKLHLPQGFSITGLGKYLTLGGSVVQITDTDSTEPCWFSSKGWYYSDGRPNAAAPDKTIVSLIELEEDNS